MTENAQDAEAIFAAALERDSLQERAAYVAGACAGNAELLLRVRELLGCHDESQGPLDRPAPGLAAVATLDEPMQECVGMEIGPYKLLQQLGEGGMGTVFLAQQSKPVERMVALKLIKPGMDSRQVIARFEAERQALALMDHPNIARVLDGGTTESGRPYFVMELVKAIPITKYCDQYRLSPRQRLELFLPICHAIQHAHQKGIIHRDVKPSNVMVSLYDGNPVPKVIDFGVAKATGSRLTDRTLFTAIGAVVGTFEYMSPEQAELNQLDVDTRSDIYSLGVLLYELLTGTTPLEQQRLREMSLLELLRAIREEDPPRPSTRVSTLNAKNQSTIATSHRTDPRRLSLALRGELDWIVMKALEKDRNRRYESANAFAADVQRYLADEPVLACPPSRAYRLRKFTRRHKRLLATSAVLTLALLVAVGAIAGSLGSMARDRATQQAVMEGRISQALNEIEKCYQRGNTDEALQTVKRAEALLASGRGSPQLQQRVDRWRNDLEMVLRLDDIRLRSRIDVKSERTTSDISFDAERAIADYVEAFRQYGIDVDSLPPAAVATLIAERPIWQELVVALENWAHLAEMSETQHYRWIEPLRESARLADTDDLRNRLRQVLALPQEQWMQRRDSLLELADEMTRQGAPPDTLLQMARVLPGERRNFLRLAQARYPGDFWINFELARKHAYFKEWDEVIRFLTAALAVRPRNAVVHWHLAGALHNKGAEKEALDTIRKSQELLLEADPQNASAYEQYAEWYAQRNYFDEAVREFEKALAARPDDRNLFFRLAAAHLGSGAPDRSREICRTMVSRFGISLDTYPTASTGPTTLACLMLTEDVKSTERLKLVPLAEVEAAQETPESYSLDKSQTLPGGGFLTSTRKLRIAYESSWRVRRLGAVLYCAGRYERAAEVLGELDRVSMLRGSDNLYLTIALHRLGRPDEARKYLDKANKWIEQADDAPRPMGWWDWTERVLVLDLRGKAKKLLDTNTAASAETKGDEQSDQPGDG